MKSIVDDFAAIRSRQAELTAHDSSEIEAPEAQMVRLMKTAIARKDAAHEPLIDLERQFLANEKRYERASIAQEAAENAAEDAGFRIRWSAVTVGNYCCYEPEEIRQHASEAGYSRQRTAELMRELRRRNLDRRQQRTASGLRPVDEECETCREEWDRIMKAIVTTPASSVAGLGVKIRFMERDISIGRTKYAHELASSAMADAERLAKGNAA